MSTFDNNLKPQLAAAVASILDPNALGNYIQYTNRNGTVLTLVGRAGKESKSMENRLQCRTETTTRVFYIPFQPEAIGPQGPTGPQGFPVPFVDGLSEFDTLQLSDGVQGIGPIYFVEPYDVDSEGVLYKINAVRYQPTKLGVD